MVDVYLRFLIVLTFEYIRQCFNTKPLFARETETVECHRSLKESEIVFVSGINLLSTIKTKRCLYEFWLPISIFLVWVLLSYTLFLEPEFSSFFIDLMLLMTRHFLKEKSREQRKYVYSISKYETVTRLVFLYLKTDV